TTILRRANHAQGGRGARSVVGDRGTAVGVRESVAVGRTAGRRRASGRICRSAPEEITPYRRRAFDEGDRPTGVSSENVISSEEGHPPTEPKKQIIHFACLSWTPELTAGPDPRAPRPEVEA